MRRWFTKWRGVHSYTFSREMTLDELREVSAHMDAAFAKISEAMDEVGRAFDGLQKDKP